MVDPLPRSIIGLSDEADDLMTHEISVKILES